MAQFQGPPPTITEVISLNESLLCKWENDPYSNSSDATLLYIDIVTNTMYSVLLNNVQITEEEYLLTGLTNGHQYAILFSILDVNGNTHNSNTETSTPSDVPAAPTILVPPSPVLNPEDNSTVDVTVQLGDNGGSAITKLVFRILLEGSSITTQQFTPVGVDGVGTYTLTGFTRSQDYIISVQAQNIAGYSNVSNSIAFRNNSSPPKPTLDVITSGTSNFVTLSYSGTTTDVPLKGVYIYYKKNVENQLISFQTFLQ